MDKESLDCEYRRLEFKNDSKSEDAADKLIDSIKYDPDKKSEDGYENVDIKTELNGVKEVALAACDFVETTLENKISLSTNPIPGSLFGTDIHISKNGMLVVSNNKPTFFPTSNTIFR